MQVKSVTTYKSKTDSSDLAFKNSYIEYNFNGDVIEAIEWSSDEEIESKILSKYNENNKITEEINFISENEISEHVTYFRTNDGSINKIEILYGDGSKTIKEYIHNTIENFKSVNIHNEDGDFEGSEFYKFDSSGNIIEKSILNFDNKLEEKITFSYNDKIQLINENHLDESDKIISSRRFTYDEHNNLLEILTVNGRNNIIEKVTTTYDEKNRITEQNIKGSYLLKITYDDENKSKTEERFTSDSNLNYVMKTIFNDKGLIVEEQTYLETTRYQYDYFDEAQQK